MRLVQAKSQSDQETQAVPLSLPGCASRPKQATPPPSVPPVVQSSPAVVPSAQLLLNFQNAQATRFAKGHLEPDKHQQVVKLWKKAHTVLPGAPNQDNFCFGEVLPPCLTRAMELRPQWFLGTWPEQYEALFSAARGREQPAESLLSFRRWVNDSKTVPTGDLYTPFGLLTDMIKGQLALTQDGFAQLSPEYQLCGVQPVKTLECVCCNRVTIMPESPKGHVTLCPSVTSVLQHNIKNFGLLCGEATAARIILNPDPQRRCTTEMRSFPQSAADNRRRRRTGSMPPSCSGCIRTQLASGSTPCLSSGAGSRTRSLHVY